MNDRITGSQDQIMAGDGSRPAAGETGVTPHVPEQLQQGITDAPAPAAPTAAARPRNRIQWIVAVALLAALVFGAVFAMNYLPYLNTQKTVAPADNPDLHRTLTFLTKRGPGAPESNEPAISSEIGTPHHFDFWFANEHDKKVVIGLKRLACNKCSAIDAYVLSEERCQSLAKVIASAVALRSASPLAGVPLTCWILHSSDRLVGADLSGTELLHQNDKLEVPPHAVGWVRLRWKGEAAGLQDLRAEVWMNDPNKGPVATLGLGAYHHEAIRTSSSLYAGTLSDDQLEKVVTHYVYVWSSTRSAFRLEATSATVRGGGPEADPFEVGTPELLGPEELLVLERKNNPRNAPSEAGGPVLSGYKVKLSFRATSRDGKVLFDLGPFHRSVLLSSPDVDAEPKRVSVRGRVAGLVDMAGGEEGGGTIDFRNFPRRDGAVASPLVLTSSVAGLELKIDTKRTPAFLEVTIKGPQKIGESSQGWTLRASVVPNKVSGTFPRAEDPLYEDSAIYLLATEPNKPPRPIRIAVRGMANES